MMMVVTFRLLSLCRALGLRCSGLLGGLKVSLQLSERALRLSQISRRKRLPECVQIVRDGIAAVGIGGRRRIGAGLALQGLFECRKGGLRLR